MGAGQGEARVHRRDRFDGVRSLRLTTVAWPLPPPAIATTITNGATHAAAHTRRPRRSSTAATPSASTSAGENQTSARGAGRVHEERDRRDQTDEAERRAFSGKGHPEEHERQHDRRPAEDDLRPYHSAPLGPFESQLCPAAFEAGHDLKEVFLVIAKADQPRTRTRVVLASRIRCGSRLSPPIFTIENRRPFLMVNELP